MGRVYQTHKYRIMKTKFLLGILAVTTGICLSCSDSNTEEPFVNPCVRANDTVRIDGVLYLDGVNPFYADRIMVEATRLKKGGEHSAFSMSNTSRNYISLCLEGKEVDVEEDWPSYRKVLLEQVGARTCCRIPYDKEVAQLPVFNYFYLLCLDNIVGADVTTESDFNATHPAGSSMNDACSLAVCSSKPFIDLVKNYKPEYPDPKDFMGDLLLPYTERAYYLGDLDALDYSRLVWPAPDGLSLHINETPSQAGAYTVVITLRMSSGNTLTYRHTVQYK